MKKRSCCAYQLNCALLIRVGRTLAFLDLFRPQIVGRDHVSMIGNSCFSMHELFEHFAPRILRLAAA
jgi:hypothetical protein